MIDAIIAGSIGAIAGVMLGFILCAVLCANTYFDELDDMNERRIAKYGDEKEHKRDDY